MNTSRSSVKDVDRSLDTELLVIKGTPQKSAKRPQIHHEYLAVKSYNIWNSYGMGCVSMQLLQVGKSTGEQKFVGLTQRHNMPQHFIVDYFHIIHHHYHQRRKNRYPV